MDEADRRIVEAECTCVVTEVAAGLQSVKAAVRKPSERREPAREP